MAVSSSAPWGRRLALLHERPGLAFVGLLAVAAVVLLPIFGTGLLCDDFQYWRRGQGVFELSAIAGVQGGKNRPLTTGLLMALLGNLDSASWLLGLLRVVHHAANALLVGLLVHRAWAKEPATGCIAALSFLLWGTHGEVYWQSSLHDVLATTGVLVAAHAGLSAIQRPSWGAIVGLGVAAFSAYWTKEAAWCLPLVLFAVSGQQSLRARLRGLGVAVLAFAPYVILRLVWVGGLWGDVVSSDTQESVGVGIVVGSVSKLLFRAAVPGWVDAQALKPMLKTVAGIAALGIAVAVAAALASRRVRDRIWAWRRAPLAMVGLAFAASLIPVSVLSVSLVNTENARYLYLPTIFIAAAVGLVWEAVRPCSRLWSSMGVAAIVAFQAVSLHAIGWNWVEATRLLETYRSALESAAEADPSPKRWVLVCPPDNFGGAFAARNASGNLVESAVVLATRYVDSDSGSSGCGYALDGKDIVVFTTDGQFAINHPSFHQGQNAVREHGWNVEAAELHNSKAHTIRITPAIANRGAAERLAVFDGQSLQIVKLPAGPERSGG